MRTVRRFKEDAESRVQEVHTEATENMTEGNPAGRRSKEKKPESGSLSFSVFSVASV
jgi:hypothetical protein